MNYSASSVQKAEREAVIDYPLITVKRAVETIFRELDSKYNRLKGGSDVFNNYQFSIQNSLNPGVGSLYLEEKGDQTLVKITVTAAYGSIATNAILESLLSGYLDVLAKTLKGDSLEVEKKQANKGGCVILVISLLIIVAGIVAFILM